MICPICNRNVQVEKQVETRCECCKSIIYQNEKLESIIIRPLVKFSKTNFIYGLLTLVSYAIITDYFINKSSDLLLIGSIELMATVAVLIREIVWYKSDEFRGLRDLLKALKTKRLKYYDLGSKILLASLFVILATEIGLLVIGLTK
nr:hypothetical protein [uncultured Carboxylicivirga sp.]